MLKSQSPMCMCEFHLMNGNVVREDKIPGGWRDFEFKQFVTKIRLHERLICPVLMFGKARSEILGFAVHWVNQMALCGEEGAAKKWREIMVVFPDLSVHVASLSLENKSWRDYQDDLTNPRMRHLCGYDLSQHGIMI